MDVSILVPLYNEEAACPRLFSGLQEAFELLSPERFSEIVLVDDGSTDRTFELSVDFAESTLIPVRVLRQSPNAGIGAAIREGFGFTSGRIVVTMDADLAYPVADAVRLCEAIDAGADVVTASPYSTGGKVTDIPGHRLLVSKACNAAYRMRLGGRARDLRTFTCGFRAYRQEILETVASDHDGFLATAQMIVRALRSDLKVVEIPSTLSGRMDGASKMRVMRTTISHLRYLLNPR